MTGRDAIADEADRAIAQAEVGAAGVPAAERVDPVLEQELLFAPGSAVEVDGKLEVDLHVAAEERIALRAEPEPAPVRDPVADDRRRVEDRIEVVPFAEHQRVARPVDDASYLVPAILVEDAVAELS